MTQHSSLEMMARYANWQSTRAQTLGDVGSTPTRATPAKAGQTPSAVRWSARPPVKRSPSLALWVQFPPGALSEIWPVLLMAQDGRFSTCEWGFESPTGHWISDEFKVMSVEMKRSDFSLLITQHSSLPNGDVDQRQESPRSERGQCGFKSHHHYSKVLQTGRRPTGSHKPGC